MNNTKTISELLSTLPQVGRVEWIGVRPERRAPIKVLESVAANVSEGLIGDRYAGSSGKRQVTLIQHEHMATIASLMASDETDTNDANQIKTLDPALLRRNISVSGINLLALKGKQFVIGNAVLEHTGLCHPCSFMEHTLGAGGYNAVRGHGGITARVKVSGLISLNDKVIFNRSL